MAGEMSPDDLEESLPLRRDAEGHRTQVDNAEDGATELESSAPRTFDRMIKGNLPTYSPLTVSRQKNETTDGGDNQTQEGRNTLSVSMSNTSSSAFNAHSPPYIRRHGGGGKGRGADNRSTADNLDMEDIYDNVGRKSATDFRGN